jgi:hypothetical protein
MPLFPWEPGWKWPWESATDTSQTLINGLIRLTIGGLVCLVGILVLAGYIGLPGGVWVRVLVGVGIFAGGLAVLLGYIGGI